MRKVKLIVPIGFDHLMIPKGTEIGLPFDLAFKFGKAGIVEFLEPERAVIEPEETREMPAIHERQTRNDKRRSTRFMHHADKESGKVSSSSD